jgi:hypothetical protein
MPAFNPTGNTVTFTAAVSGSVPTPVQCLSNDGTQSPAYLITNLGSVPVFIGVGKTAAVAIQRAVVPAPSSAAICIMPSSSQAFTLPPDAFFTGITGSGTAVVYVAPGNGE